MDLRHLTDRALLTDTRILVSKEREISVKILHHLKEIDKRRLYSDLGYSSIFEFCLRELGYSEGAANRRIRAARELEKMPEIEAEIEQGNINLSTLNQALTFFNQQSIEDKEQKLEILEKIKNKSHRECEKELIIISGQEAPPPKNLTRRISKNFIRLNISLEESVSSKLDELKTLFGREKSMSALFDFMISVAKIDLEKKKYHLHKKSKDSPPAPAEARVISAGVKRKVYLRDNKKCTICGSTHRLQFDHRTPFALGGKSDEKNIRLVCFNCNQRLRIKAGLTKKRKAP